MTPQQTDQRNIGCAFLMLWSLAMLVAGCALGIAIGVAMS